MSSAPLSPAFADIGIPERPAKPRSTGLTITVEFGLGCSAQRDLLDTAAPAMDFVKLAVGLARLIPLEVLRSKARIYREYGVEPFPGGMFLEYAVVHGAAETYFDAALDAGYRVVEVSENAAPLDNAVKSKLVRTALERGFTVLGEVGSKHEQTSIDTLVDNGKRLLDDGCWKVLVEAAELMADGALRLDLLSAIEHSLPIDSIVFELPGPWLAGVHHHQVNAMEAELVRHFGPEVNIANDPVGNALFLESIRRGIGPNVNTDL